MNKNVKKFENKMANYVGTKYSVFVSSGSTANTILAYYLKDKFYAKEKKIVLFPSTTWITSISPFIREGFVPKFIDISLNDLCMDLDKLEEYLKINSNKVCCIFYTSLLGNVPDIEKLEEISKKYNVKIMMDNCENTFGKFNGKNISSYFTSTTSTYFGHQLQSVEGGFIFTNDKKEYDLFLMYRNHGMTRSVENNKIYRNINVDPQFDFYLMGNNFRNSDIHAYIGLLDFDRIETYIQKRVKLFNHFKSKVNTDILDLTVEGEKCFNVPFSIPLIFKNIHNKSIILEYCKKNNIETRPIISGNLLKQTCLANVDNYLIYTNSQYIDTNGFYVGLHPKVNIKQLNLLIEEINKLYI
jgi:CDP-6-deoxy-D-xylo-4-hexulose-3-dehydrase